MTKPDRLKPFKSFFHTPPLLLAAFVFLAISFFPTQVDAAAYDISSATFTQVALTGGVQNQGPTALIFNDDGTTLYVMDSPGAHINEYTLDEPYDISTASFTQVALSVGAQETIPFTFIFNDDGTTLYVMGSSGVDINEYTLDEPYDISTASFTQVALSVGAQETFPTALIFNDDGTTLYVMGSSGADINEYALFTPYDISSATFTQVALSVGAQETIPFTFIFNDDGTTLYVMGSSGVDINEYTLDEPYDISTASFTQVALDVVALDTFPTALIFNDDGTTLYVMGLIGTSINEYSLGDAIAPTIDTLSPADNATDVAIDAEFAISFTEAVVGGSGLITLKKVSDDSTVEEFQFIFDTEGEDTLIFAPELNLDYETEYYIQIDADSFTDIEGNPFAGLTDSTLWSFTTVAYVDETAPTIISLSPVDNATDVAVDTGLTLTFDEPVSFDSGEILLKKSSDNTTIATIPVAGGDASDAVLSVGFADNLEYETEYYIQISATAIADAANNNFAGIADTTTWSFTTEVVISDDENEESSGSSRSGSSGGVHYGCKDTNASNYEYFSRHKQELCRYDTVVTTTTTSLSVLAFPVRDLEFSMIGEDVLALQTLLNANGFLLAESGVGSPGNETTFFGTLTRAALSKYQAANGIDPTAGYFGLVTRGQMKASGVPGLWW